MQAKNLRSVSKQGIILLFIVGFSLQQQWYRCDIATRAILTAATSRMATEASAVRYQPVTTMHKEGSHLSLCFPMSMPYFELVILQVIS
jgi:penicillin-binding protein-related factor A (putative recombinase)